MLKEYVRRHVLDIVLIEEITAMGLLNIPGYDYTTISGHTCAGQL